MTITARGPGRRTGVRLNDQGWRRALGTRVARRHKANRGLIVSMASLTGSTAPVGNAQKASRLRAGSSRPDVAPR
jgi:hypothetical protein